LLDSQEFTDRLGAALRRFVPPGHYYSPIPSDRDIDEFAARHSRPDSLPGVTLDDTQQIALLGELTAFYPSLPFDDQPRPGLRYRYINPSYSYSDAIFLHTMLRRLKPKRLIEIGSGYSSAVTLDTNEQFLSGTVACTFIEPFPDLLFSLLKPGDRQNVTIVPKRLQEVDITLFDELRARDVLFVDSTHVSKVNSDVNRIVFEILPRLADGVFIHIHDVFSGFEYPIDWLREGRAWNEQYLLRAFLQFNADFKIRLLGNYLVQRYPDWFREHMPLCLKNPGGALWLERTA
jgi:hypothetical protein